jgi:type II secretory pathway pseudopilin PulG
MRNLKKESLIVFKKNKSGGGFTLIEILVYIAVLGILMILLSSFLIWSNQSNIKAKTMRETLEDARRAIEIIAHEIKEAESVYTPTTNPSQLSLETRNYLPTGEESSYIDFFLCNSSLCFKKESQNPAVLTKENVEVNNLVFTRIVSGDFSSIKIELGVNYRNPNNRPEYQTVVNLTSTASLRSY